MGERGIDEQLNKYLTDVHAIEEQALTQLRRAPEIAGSSALAAPFEQHLEETERQEQRVRGLLEARGAEPSTVKDVAGKAGGFGMVLFAKLNPDTPGKLAAHAYSYEHLEIAAYELLALAAEQAGADDVALAAREIEREEREMAGRLAGTFDAAVEASLREVEPDGLDAQLDKYLADAHAIEAQAIQMLESAPKLVEDEQLSSLFEEHLEETKGHEKQVRARLEARGSGPSRFQDAAMGIGALNVGAFFKAQPDTTAKLAGYAFSFEALEIAAYELLSRVAARVGDNETVEVAGQIRAEESAAARKLEAAFESALMTSLASHDVRPAA